MRGSKMARSNIQTTDVGLKTKRVSEKLLKEIIKRLVAEFQPYKIILFGSHAWGRPDEDSDLDLYVIIPDSKEKSTRRAVRAYHSLRGLAVAVDVLVKTRDEAERYRCVPASLEAEIFERGRVLYGG